MLIQLSAYTVSQQQTAFAILVQGRDVGLNLTDLIDALQLNIQGSLPTISQDHRQVAAESELCPSCGKEILLPVINRDGLHIAGCRRCRFSRIEAPHGNSL